MSSSYNNAEVAARNVSNVRVVDSRSLSTGIGLLVLKACDFADEGDDGETIFNKITELIPHVQASFVVDTMEYLYKGGRCSGVKMLLASALSLKPMIMLKDGKWYPGKIRR